MIYIAYSLKVNPPKNTSVTEMYVGYSMFLRKRTDFWQKWQSKQRQLCALKSTLSPKPNQTQLNTSSEVHLDDIL